MYVATFRLAHCLFVWEQNLVLWLTLSAIDISTEKYQKPNICASKLKTSPISTRTRWKVNFGSFFYNLKSKIWDHIGKTAAFWLMAFSPVQIGCDRRG